MIFLLQQPKQTMTKINKFERNQILPLETNHNNKIEIKQITWKSLTRKLDTEEGISKTLGSYEKLIQYVPYRDKNMENIKS